MLNESIFFFLDQFYNLVLFFIFFLLIEFFHYSSDISIIILLINGLCFFIIFLGLFCAFIIFYKSFLGLGLNSYKKKKNQYYFVIKSSVIFIYSYLNFKFYLNIKFLNTIFFNFIALVDILKINLQFSFVKEIQNYFNRIIFLKIFSQILV